MISTLRKCQKHPTSIEICWCQNSLHRSKLNSICSDELFQGKVFNFAPCIRNLMVQKFQKVLMLFIYLDNNLKVFRNQRFQFFHPGLSRKLHTSTETIDCKKNGFLFRLRILILRVNEKQKLLLIHLDEKNHVPPPLLLSIKSYIANFDFCLTIWVTSVNFVPPIGKVSVPNIQKTVINTDLSRFPTSKLFIKASFISLIDWKLEAFKLLLNFSFETSLFSSVQ